MGKTGMQLFVYEYLSAGVDRSLPASLRAEGWAMLAAVCTDFAQLPAIEVRTLVAADDEQDIPACRMVRIQAADEETALRNVARWADYSLVIAPEFGGILERRCRWVEEEKGRLVGSSSQAVQLVADKLALSERLRDADVRMPPCVPISRAETLGYPVVCKPRRGAGSQATFLVRDEVSLLACVEQARREGCTEELIAQRYVSGRAASVSFLIGPRGVAALAPAAQHLSDDGRFRYQGGTVPLPEDLAKRAVAIAQPAVAHVPGLRGCVGVDVVLGVKIDGSCDSVIEINPRLTTSYLGLRALARENLAKAMLQVVQRDEIPALSWRPGSVTFRTNSPCPHSFTRDPQIH